jgi:opacity protein-like surface antigen
MKALLLAASLAAICGPMAQAAAPKTVAAKIANAMTAAPAAVSRNAAVAEMKEDGSMLELRKGTNGWTCVPDDPSTPGNDPMCLDPNAMEWLHAYTTKAAPPNKIGFIYMLQGGWDFSNLDPYATKPDGGKATITGPHVMVVGPGVKSAPGYDRTGNGVNARIPYVMWKDSPYEHLMIPMR